MSTHVGISGWTYRGWRGSFYPSHLAHRLELNYASRKFNSIEVNGTFYRLQRPETFLKWYDSTPESFIFSVKGHRYITHLKRLNSVKEALKNFFASGPLNLQEKLGVFLWQFPPSLRFEPERINNFLELLPKSRKEALKLAGEKNLPAQQLSDRLRHAFEVRHDSFYNPHFIEMLRKHGVALVFADTAGKWPYMEDVTADFIYVRLHGDSELYVSGYGPAAIDFWANRIHAWRIGQEPRDRLTLTEDKASQLSRDVYVYFDNDAKVRAPVDAQNLQRALH